MCGVEGEAEESQRSARLSLPMCRYHSQSISAVCCLNYLQSYVNTHTHRYIDVCAFVCASKKILCCFIGPAFQHSPLSVHPTTRPMCFTLVLNEQQQSPKDILLYNFFLFYNCGVVAAYKSLLCCFLWNGCSNCNSDSNSCESHLSTLVRHKLSCQA